jgi:hypothetical protein
VLLKTRLLFDIFETLLEVCSSIIGSIAFLLGTVLKLHDDDEFDNPVCIIVWLVVIGLVLLRI